MGLSSTRLVVFIGGTREARAAAVHAAFPPTASPPLRAIHSAIFWPRLRHVMPPIQPPVLAPRGVREGGSATFWFRDLHLAFPRQQTPGIRLVLTQSTYQLQRVLDALDANPNYAVVADGDDSLRTEAAGRRGPWARIDIRDLGPAPEHAPTAAAIETPAAPPASEAALLLNRATERLREQDIAGARALVEQAIAIDPGWEAAHFELGKLALMTEDTAGAAESFAEAGRLMPTFAAAFSNLGAALGELERLEEALAALAQALANDPNGFPTVSNLGAVYRDLGRLDDAEHAFRRAIALAPSFVFGHYNLGHTLFLQGRFAEARDAYEAGMHADPQKNPRQACRLAVARCAAGDSIGGARELEAIASRVPEDVMRDLAVEADETLGALQTLPAFSNGELAVMIAAVQRYLRT
jgi:tetratricopeptide (TPR) repeat protein